MLTLAEKILFILLAAGSLYYAYTGFRRVYLAIRRGRPEERFDRLPERVGRALWLVLTQQTVFKRRPLVSLLHAFVFYGFVYYLLVNLVDFLEGFFGLHARGGIWNAYNIVADLLTFLILVGILGLMLRRYLLAPRDFTWNPNVPLHEKARAGIARDSAIVGAFIAFHVGSRLLSKAFQLAGPSRRIFQNGRYFGNIKDSLADIFKHHFRPSSVWLDNNNISKPVNDDAGQSVSFCMN